MRGDDAYAILKKKIEKNQTQPGATPEQAAQIQQNKEDITALKEETDKKITKIYASNQGETHLKNSDNGPIQNMMVYGKSEQKQYSGKNLFKATLGNVTMNGITCTANGDGTYILNGTCSANTALSTIGIFDHILNKPLYLTGVPTGCSSYLALGRYDGNNILVTNGEIAKIDAGIHTKHIEFWITEGTVLNNVIFKPMLTTDLTATYDDFEPYTGGQPSPSPDYPQEIKSVVNPTVKVVGKNLLNANNISTGIINSNGNVEENNTYFYTDFIRVKNEITVSFYIDKDYIRVAKYDSEGKFITRLLLAPGSIKNVTINDCSFIKVSALKDDINNIQIELGSTPTSYEPYHEQTVTLPYTLNAIPVNSGGNVTIDGQQYVSDYFDVERGKLVRMVADNRLRSAYNWNTANEYYWGSVSATTNGKAPITADNSKKMCACNYLFASSTYDVMAKKSGIAINNIKQVVIGLNDFASVDEFKTFLTNNDVRLVYPLEVPEEIDLTPGEIQALKALATYYPVTNISVNSEQLDGYTVFNYPLPFEDEWNNVKQQVNDIQKDYLTKEDAKKEYQPKGDYPTKEETKEIIKAQTNHITFRINSEDKGLDLIYTE